MTDWQPTSEDASARSAELQEEIISWKQEHSEAVKKAASQADQASLEKTELLEEVTCWEKSVSNVEMLPF